MITMHCLLQSKLSIHLLLQSGNPARRLKPIYSQAQICPHQPIKRWERFAIHYRCHANHQRLALLICDGDRPQSPGLSTQQCGDARALVGGEGHVVMVSLHEQMLTPGSIDPGIECQ
jgi:hypothetical protein